MMNTLLDVCAGIGSFSLAAQRANIPIVAQIEYDKFRTDLLSKCFPETVQLGDLYDIKATDIPQPVSILAGGTPCPNFSIAGDGSGLDGEDSKLWYEYLRLAQELKPAWVLWENVPNALSTNGGLDFLTILQGLDELGYHVAWRVLDAQYFGVPQRRRRIFLVGHLEDGRAAKVLFESESVQGSAKTRPKTWDQNTRVIGTLTKSASGIARPRGQGAELEFLVYGNQGFGQPYKETKIGRTICKSDDSTNSDLIVFNNFVRRLTPLECERLQGFPDGWTDGYSDNQRYQMLGDSIAVPVAQWIINRIKEIS